MGGRTLARRAGLPGGQKTRHRRHAGDITLSGLVTKGDTIFATKVPCVFSYLSSQSHGSGMNSNLFSVTNECVNCNSIHAVALVRLIY